VGNAFAIDANGKLLVAGSTGVLNGTDFGFARYLPGNGTTGAYGGGLDTSFSGDGLQQISFGGYNYANAVVGTPDGGLIAAGDANSGTQWGIVRLNADGSPNTGFDGDGKRTDSFGANGGHAFAAALDASGKLLVAGSWSPTPS